MSASQSACCFVVLAALVAACSSGDSRPVTPADLALAPGRPKERREPSDASATVVASSSDAAPGLREMSEFIVSTPIASILGRSVVVTDMSNGIANSYCHAQALPMSQKWAAILGMRIADPICAYPKSTTELVVCVSVVGANDKPPMIALFLTASPASLVGVVVDESGISDASAHLAMAKKMVDRLDAVDRSLCP